MLHLNLRRQELAADERGHAGWRVRVEAAQWPAAQTALLLCDVWDHHWCRGAEERLEAMIPRMNRVVGAARRAGVQIVHAPSDTLDFYRGHPARERVLSVPAVEPPPPIEHADPPLPVDASDGGSDTGEKPWRKAWTRQHPGIEIDPERDALTDKGVDVYGFLRARGIERLLVMGVHTNMCVLHRTFGIKQMVRWGVPVALIRDLTDTMYNPAVSPYVSHGEGTRLVVEFIEKFWAPTVLSADLLG